jgi:hypothetical protein
MEEVATSTAKWNVSTRSSGEVLAVQTQGPGLDLGFVGAPRGFTQSEIQGWLTELTGVAGAAGVDSPALRDPALPVPIPRILHQALTGLLFYEAELWGGPGVEIPCATACQGAGEHVAFGWTGPGRVECTQGGQPFQPPWLVVRDQEGREARAFVTDARLPLEVRLTWSAGTGGEGVGGEIQARWPGLSTSAPETAGSLAPERQSERGAVSAEGATPRANRPAPEEPAPRTQRPRGSWRFRGWMDRLAGPRPGDGAEPEPIAHDVPGVPELIPEPQAVAPVAEAELPPGVVAEAPALEREAQPAESEPPGPVTAEPPIIGAESRPPQVEDVLTAGQVHGIDPFDLGTLEPFDAGPACEPAAADASVRLDAVEPQVPAGPGSPAVPVEQPAAEQAPVPIARPVTIIEPDIDVWPQEPTVRTRMPERARPRPVRRHPAWPEPEETTRSDSRPLWQRRWFLAAVVVALFAGGWFLGRVDFSRGSRGLSSALKAMGLGPARYEVSVTSRPSGAWISVDGVDQGRRTPFALELEPGAHEVVLSFSGVGGSSHTVTGKRGQRVALDVELWGALKVAVPGSGVPIAVSVDGMQRGYAPLEVERLQPGIHRLQFSGPGVAPWEQTVEVHVNRTAELLAQPIVSPTTGVLEVRATLADETGTEPLKGAQVSIDGQPRGTTPLRLELPRGPHSILVRYRNEAGPVQVIELPGGNLRYATIELGLDVEAPRLSAALPGPILPGRPTVLSAMLDGAHEGDLREMWLHVQTPEGAWRRYPMNVMKAAGGLVGVAVFPSVLFDGRGRTAWYVSALTPMGDEYFTEIQPAQAASRH